MQDELTPFRGGESEALKRLRGAMDEKVCYCALLPEFLPNGTSIMRLVFLFFLYFFIKNSTHWVDLA